MKKLLALIAFSLLISTKSWALPIANGQGTQIDLHRDTVGFTDGPARSIGDGNGPAYDGAGDLVGARVPVPDPQTTPVPEPTTLVLLGIGMAGLALHGRSRMKS